MKHTRKLLIIVVLAVALTACGTNGQVDAEEYGYLEPEASAPEPPAAPELPIAEPTPPAVQEPVAAPEPPAEPAPPTEPEAPVPAEPQPPAPPPIEPEPQVGSLDYAGFRMLLAESGFEYTISEPIANGGILGGTRWQITIGDEEPISVHEYATVEEMEKNSLRVRDNGFTIYSPEEGEEFFVEQISWVSWPNFYKHGRIIVLYVGEDEQILEFLGEIFGEVFAGHR